MKLDEGVIEEEVFMKCEECVWHLWCYSGCLWGMESFYVVLWFFKNNFDGWINYKHT